MGIFLLSIVSLIYCPIVFFLWNYGNEAMGQWYNKTIFL